MKSILLAMAVAAFASGSAFAQCSHGVAYLSKPAEKVAQSQMQKPMAQPEQYASLADAWLIKYLDKVQS